MTDDIFPDVPTPPRDCWTCPGLHCLPWVSPPVEWVAHKWTWEWAKDWVLPPMTMQMTYEIMMDQIIQSLAIPKDIYMGGQCSYSSASVIMNTFLSSLRLTK